MFSIFLYVWVTDAGDAFVDLLSYKFFYFIASIVFVPCFYLMYSIGCWILSYAVLYADDLYPFVTYVEGNCGVNVGG